MFTKSLRSLPSAAALIAVLVIPSGCKRATAEGARLQPEEIQEVAEEAYIYGYPLVTMEMTRRVLTNVAEPTGNHAPMGQFAQLRSYPTAAFRDVTAPNANTLYSTAFIDVGNEPYVLTLPEEHGRYYLMPMLDAWTTVFASPGTRTSGTHPQRYLIAGPGWKGRTPPGMKLQRSPTTMVWLIGRTFAKDTPADIAAVHAIQDQYTLTPLSKFGPRYSPPAGSVDPSVDTKTPVRDQVNALSTVKFFQMMASLMATNPPTPADSAIVGRMRKIGLVAGEPFDGIKLTQDEFDSLSIISKRAWEKIAAAGEAGERVNGWTYPKMTGKYKTHYLLRAATAAFGLGANLMADAVYPVARVDGNGAPLSGANPYVLHFANGELPPVKAFWSLTMYDDKFFFVENSINRYQISPKQSPVAYNADGSLDLYIQHSPPAKEHLANWLPAPEGSFQLMLRMYWPDRSVVTGAWKAPAVMPALVMSASR